jgi:hypothetical protein
LCPLPPRPEPMVGRHATGKDWRPQDRYSGFVAAGACDLRAHKPGAYRADAGLRFAALVPDPECTQQVPSEDTPWPSSSRFPIAAMAWSPWPTAARTLMQLRSRRTGCHQPGWRALGLAAGGSVNEEMLCVGRRNYCANTSRAVDWTVGGMPNAGQLDCFLQAARLTSRATVHYRLSQVGKRRVGRGTML